MLGSGPAIRRGTAQVRAATWKAEVYKDLMPLKFAWVLERRVLREACCSVRIEVETKEIPLAGCSELFTDGE